MSEHDQNGANAYDAASAAGTKQISKSWRRLSDATRARLAHTEGYSDDGVPKTETPSSFGDDLGDFEYNLGVLVFAVEAKLPGRNEPGAPISAEVLKDDVLTAAATMLYSPYGRDASFLRTAIFAVRKHQIANLLTRLLPLKSESAIIGMARAILYIFGFTGLLFAAPAILASVLVAAGQGNQGDAALGLYALAVLGMMWGYAKNSKAAREESTIEEQTYLSWISLDSYLVGDPTARGAGAKAYFENMLRREQSVPPVLFDLCETLMECTRHSYERPQSQGK